MTETAGYETILDAAGRPAPRERARRLLATIGQDGRQSLRLLSLGGATTT